MPVQAVLGNMYEQGRGVLQDYVRAHMWWNIAASSEQKLLIL
jgi:TPR repeat protein